MINQRTLARLFCPLLALLLTSAAEAQWRFKQPIHTRSGIVVVGYARTTRARIVRYGKTVMWRGTIGNRHETTVRLRSGTYTLEATDEVRVLSEDLAAYLRDERPAEPPRSSRGRDATPNGSVSVVPVPWPRDASFALDPPSFQSRHVVLRNVPTRLKAVIKGGSGPFTVEWDPGDGSGVVTANPSATDRYNGAAYEHTYDLPIGTPVEATVRITDQASPGQPAISKYYLRIGNPGSRADRVARSTDEALWYMHSRLTRVDNVVTGSQPAVDMAYPDVSASIATAAMFAICLENTGRSVTGGRNFSNDPGKDAYVDDLNRLINYLTDEQRLAPVAWSGVKTYSNGIGDVNPESHPTGGNGILLRSNGISTFYEGGMHLQAICQAGFVDAPVPNRTEYASYYDLIGDFVDGCQYGQATSGWALGGWRYDFSYGDSDGSVVAWVGIGLRAAEEAYRLTPMPSRPPIELLPQVKEALAAWLDYDIAKEGAGAFGVYDYRLKTNRSANYWGGYGYTGPTSYTNAAKTGGGLAALRLLQRPIDDPLVKSAMSFLYRTFFTPDGSAGWGSARDSYGMYNILKGLQEYGITDLADPLATGANDIDGLPMTSIDWFAELADFIAGTSDTDLGHQRWPTNSIGAYVSGANDGHFEPTGVRTGDWDWALADQSTTYYAGADLITAWDTAILQSTVFVPAPVAVIAHPDANTGETFVPVQVNGEDFSMVADPAGSYELNPTARITRVRWEFGDGAIDDYVLPFPSDVGGSVPQAPGIRPAGNQTSHHYTALGSYVLKLTVYDDQGQSNSTTTTVRVVPAPFPPTARLTVTSVDTAQDGDTVVINPDGTVTLRLDASASSNPDPSSVVDPKNASGISTFYWEWPTNPDQGYNDGRSELPPPGLFDQGELAQVPELTADSKDPVQTYTFRFDPARVQNGTLSRITIGVRVKSNIAQGENMPPDTVTLLRQVNLVTTLVGGNGTAVEVTPTVGFQELPADLTARLTSADDASPIAGRDLIFSIDGVEAGSASTTTTGVATLTYTLPGSITVGTHVLSAAFGGDAQLKPSSGSAELRVKGAPSSNRRLPRSYVPEGFSPVVIEVLPPRGTALWELSETPPAGWTISSISQGGTATDGVIHWGPFTTDAPANLRYSLTAPADASGTALFTGALRLDGDDEPVGGDRAMPLDAASTFHPADTGRNGAINISELVAYGSAWSRGAAWPVPPSSIPITYVTNAGLIWKQGETYHHDAAQDPPFVPGATRTRSTVPRGMATASARSSASSYRPNRAVRFTISARPNRTSSWALEEKVPSGWTVKQIDSSGRLVARTNTIRWGPFSDNRARTLTYVCVPSATATGTQRFTGTVSADGKARPVGGARTLHRR